jgi:hypothetical protein
MRTIEVMDERMKRDVDERLFLKVAMNKELQAGSGWV